MYLIINVRKKYKQIEKLTNKKNKKLNIKNKLEKLKFLSRI